MAKDNEEERELYCGWCSTIGKPFTFKATVQNDDEIPSAHKCPRCGNFVPIE